MSRDAPPESFREFHARTTDAPWPGFPREPFSAAFERLAVALAAWADRVAVEAREAAVQEARRLDEARRRGAYD